MADLDDDMFEEQGDKDEDTNENGQDNDNKKEFKNNEELRKYLFGNMNQNTQTKEPKEYDYENDFIKINCFFKDIKLIKHDKLFDKDDKKKNFNRSYELFFCDSDIKNEITGVYCEPEKLCCLKCMKNNQKMYALKPNYLVNAMGRVCKFKKNKIYCKGKLSKIDVKDDIEYSFNYVCRPSYQCEACKELTKYMDKYYGEKLMAKLRKREEK